MTLVWVRLDGDDLGPVSVPDSVARRATPARGPLPQPIPRADGQAGHFEPTGGLKPEPTACRHAAPTGVGDGWYSYNLGTWHLISLNIECYTQPGGCSNTGSWFAAELAWLQNDLADESFRVHTGLLAPAHVQRY